LADGGSGGLCTLSRIPSAQTASRILVSATETALTIVFSAGVASKLLDPRPTFELAQVVTRSATAALGIVVLGVVVEIGLVGAILTRCIRGPRAIGLGLVLVVGVSIWLLISGHLVGDDAECGCMTALWPGTIADALVGNGILAAESLLALGMAWWARARRSRGIPSRSTLAPGRSRDLTRE